MQVSFNKVQAMCNILRSRFPYCSPWELKNITAAQVYKEYKMESDIERKLRLVDELKKMYSEFQEKLLSKSTITRETEKYTDKPYLYFTTLINGIDSLNTFWCGAASKLMYMVCRMNSVEDEDVERAVVALDDKHSELLDELSMPDIYYDTLDHVVNRVRTSDGIAEVDPLMNRVYHEGEMKKSLENNYAKALDIPEGMGVKLVKKNEITGNSISMPFLDKVTIEKLKSQYPELIV